VVKHTFQGGVSVANLRGPAYNPPISSQAQNNGAAGWVDKEGFVMDYAAARNLMVEAQLRTNKVTHPGVLDAMRSVPRELFAPKSRREFAYVDEDIEVEPGRYLMEPMVLGRLLDSAQPKSDDLALVVSAAPGYAAAVLGRVTATVFAQENDPAMAKRMADLLHELQLDNVVVVDGAAREGRPAEAPFDLILVPGSVPDVPASLTDQLAENGRLVTVVQENEAIGRAVLYLKRGGTVSRRVLFDATVGKAPGFERVPGFVF